jgi:hypothetical protein
LYGKVHFAIAANRNLKVAVRQGSLCHCGKSQSEDCGTAKFTLPLRQIAI